MDYPILFALDNRGLPNLEHCFGAPFIAKDFDSAQEMVKKALGDKKDLVDLKQFYLVQLCGYDITRESPIIVDDDFGLNLCVADFIVSEVADEQE